MRTRKFRVTRDKIEHGEKKKQPLFFAMYVHGCRMHPFHSLSSPRSMTRNLLS